MPAFLYVRVSCLTANLGAILQRGLSRKQLLFWDELPGSKIIVGKPRNFSIQGSNTPFDIHVLFLSFFFRQGMLIKSSPYSKNFIYLNHFSPGGSSPECSWMLPPGTADGDKRFICSWHPSCLIWNQASLSPGASCGLSSTLLPGALGLGSYRS